MWTECVEILPNSLQSAFRVAGVPEITLIGMLTTRSGRALTTWVPPIVPNVSRSIFSPVPIYWA
jgi:hypothetical protein